jgi:hypothetical protein
MWRLLLNAVLGALTFWPDFGLAETPEELKARLERGRELDRQETLRRQETIQWQKRRKAEEYARTWKQYGNAFEVNVLSWWKQADGNWVTYAKFVDPTIGSIESNSKPDWVSPPPDSARRVLEVKPPKRFAQSLDQLVRQGVISCDDRLLFADQVTQQASCSNSKASLVGVSCSSLHVNKKMPFRAWGKWERPIPGSPEESLLIERCSKQ